MPGVAPKDWPGLAAVLSAFDDRRLGRLLAQRPDLASPPPRDWSALASRAGSWPSAQAALRGLDRAGVRVVEALCLLPGPAELTDVAALLEVPPTDADLVATLTRLEDRALAFGLGEHHVYLLPALRQLDYPAGLGPPLASMLAGMTGMGLQQMAVRIGLKPAKVMAETEALIVGALSDPATVAALVGAGPPGVPELAARASTVGPLVAIAGGMYGFSDRTPAGWMVNRGLLGVVDYYHAAMPQEPTVALRGGRIFAPGCLRGPVPDRGPVDAAAVDRSAAEAAARLVLAAAALLEVWSAEPAAMLKAGGLGIREVRRAAKVLDAGEVETARVIELVAAAGLAGAEFGSERAMPTAAYDEWLALETPARWARLAGAWIDADLDVSGAGAIGANGKPIPPLLPRGPDRDARRRRRLVLDALLEVGPGEAVAPASVHDRVTWASPAAWTGGPAPAATLVRWAQAEAEMLGICALGALSTPGRAIAAGRPVEAGEALAALLPPAVTEFVIQADLTAVIAGEPAPAVRTELDLLADVESKGAATVYRFTEQSLRRGFDSGRTAAGIAGFLERHATRGVPQPLAYLVNDLGRRHGNIRLGAATTYVRSDDTALLAEVLQARATAKLRLRSLAPTVLVTAAGADAVSSTLRAAGFLPALESAGGGLVVARPEAHRLPAVGFGYPAPPPAPAIPAIVAALRLPPLASAPAPRPQAQAPAPGPWPELGLLDLARPAAIVKDATTIRIVLDQACEEFWLVRLSYVGSDGHGTELTVEPVEVDRRHMHAYCVPAGNHRRFVLDRIEWLRVLTEAEESMLGVEQ